MAETVIHCVLKRLKEIGVDDVFGVAGDYAFPVNDAIVEDPLLNWIGCCNELNAAYAADGYARMRGVAALCTTFGVGELAAMSGIAGAYAEHLAVFHLVGTPNSATQEGRALAHHTPGNGEFDLFHRMAEPIVCASAAMTPQNVASETERLKQGHGPGLPGVVHRTGEQLRVLDDALKTAEQADGAAYIEVITDAYEAPPMYKKLHENVKSFYNIH